MSEEETPNFLMDNCASCGNDYEIHQHKDAMFLFLLSPDCNHIEAICPNCGQEKVLFLEPEVVLYVMRQAHLSVKLALQASEDFQAIADEWNGVILDADLPDLTKPLTMEDLPELSWNEFRSLSNDIRKLERGET